MMIDENDVRTVIRTCLKRYQIDDDDIAQEAWVAALLADISYRPELGVERWKWIRAKVRWSVLSEFRRRRQPSVPIGQIKYTRDETELWIIRESIQQAMIVLTEKQKAIIYAVYWQGVSIATVARKTNRHMMSVYKTHSLALRRMREVLA